MKLTILLLTVGLLHASANTTGQTVTISGQDLKLENVFSMVEKQTGFVVFATMDILRTTKPVTLNVTEMPVSEFIGLALKDQGLTYEIANQTILISKKKSVVTVFDPANLSPELDPPPVTGMVHNSDGQPIAGVNIIVKKTNKGTTSDSKGKFTIDAKPGDILIVSSIGFASKEIRLTDEMNIVIALEVNNSPLDEVQIIAYGTTSQRFSTGNVNTVKAKDIEKQPVNNPLLALQGRVPGLFIEQSTGFAGSGVKVRIQGQNSLSKGNEPLYIIDGVPYISNMMPGGSPLLGRSGGPQEDGYGNPLSFINPGDIESIDVLKDADATAIYGSRAANGAILITTKRGKAGQVKIELNLQSGWGRVARKLDLMDNHQYLEMRREALKNDGLVPVAGSFGDNDLNGNWDTSRNIDWQKQLIGGSAKYNDFQSTISGGTGATNFLIGANYHKETTVFPGDFSDTRASVHFSINTATPGQRFAVQFSGSYLIDDNQLPTEDFTSDAMKLAPLAPSLYTPDGSVNWAPDSTGTSTFISNPIGHLQNVFRNKTNNLVANTILSYQLMPGFYIKSSFGYNRLQSDQINKFLLTAWAPEYQPYIPRSTAFTNNMSSSWVIEPQLTYNHNIGKGKLDALLGSTIQKTNADGSSAIASGFSSDLVMEDILSAPILSASSSFNSVYRYNALFGRINYNWDSRYILNLTARRDGSSRFGPENRFHNFSAIAGAWIFSESRFIHDRLPFLSFGKINASYGTTGSDQIGEYQYLSLYSSVAQTIPYQGISLFQPTGLANPLLQWEATKKAQVGINLGFLKDRILLNLIYYRNQSSNQLNFYSLPATTGFTFITRNQEFTIRNMGWEISLSSVNIRKKDFTWSSNFNITIPRTLLVDFPNIDKSSARYTAIVGKPLGAMYVYHFLGVDPVTGVYQFGDKDGKATTTPIAGATIYGGDATVILNPFPGYYGGLQNSFTYKGFQLDFLFQFAKQVGANTRFGTTIPGNFSGGAGNQLVKTLDRWQKQGDEKPFQRYTTGYDVYTPFFNVTQSDAVVTDASYIRLKNLAFSWQIPGTWSRKAHVQNWSLFLRGQNLLTFTKYEGLDPESKSSTTLPPLRVVTLGTRITF